MSLFRWRPRAHIAGTASVFGCSALTIVRAASGGTPFTSGGSLSEEEVLNLEKNLSNPEGDAGIELAKMMHKRNKGMIRNGIQALKLQDGDRLLELGHGPCYHLTDVMQKARGIHYTGLEISETMLIEAVTNNQYSINNRCQARFDLYDGVSLPSALIEEAQQGEGKEPLEQNQSKKNNLLYTKILCSNCVYFWKEPGSLLKQLRWVIDEGQNEERSRLVFAFLEKEYLNAQIFAKDRFKNRFSPEEFQRFADEGGFQVSQFETFEEGKEDKRLYHIGVLVPK